MLSQQIAGLTCYSRALYARRALSAEEYAKLYATAARIPTDVSVPFLRDLKRWAYICEVYAGLLTPIRARHTLTTGEHAYFEAPMTLRKETETTTRDVAATLLLTDRHLYVLSKTPAEQCFFALGDLVSTTCAQQQITLFFRGHAGVTIGYADPELLDAFLHALSSRF